MILITWSLVGFANVWITLIQQLSVQIAIVIIMDLAAVATLMNIMALIMVELHIRLSMGVTAHTVVATTIRL